MRETIDSAAKRVALRARPRALADFREEGERVMETLLAPWGPFRVLAGEVAGPPVDVYVEGRALHIEVESPGVHHEDVEIQASADTITIKGEKRAPAETQKRDYYRRERAYERFTRHIGLPVGADVEHATASFKDGVLCISIPLAGEPGTTKIEITHAGEA